MPHGQCRSSLTLENHSVIFSPDFVKGTPLGTNTWLPRPSHSGSSWIEQHRLKVLASLFAAGIFVLIFGLDWLSSRQVFPPVLMIAVDAAVGLLCGALLLKVLSDARARQRAVLQRLEMIGDMNHHIRNALEQIQMSAHTTHDQALIQNVETALERIQWALNEVLPQNREQQ